ncbi:MAG: T9SS type A sorting domain-containing protein, partial [Draconibacterium sp.]
STETTFDENAEWDLEVYNSMQSLKLKKQKLKGNSVTINTQSWKEGVYMVRVKYKDKILTGKLVVQK